MSTLPEMFKAGFDGDRPSPNLTPPEKQAFLPVKHALVKRIHEAMLTLSATGGMGDLGITTGGTPQHIVEFADRVGEEKAEAPPARFQPNAAQVDDMIKALDLLQGLTKPYFKVVFLRALHQFAKDSGGRGDWTWESIGGYFGLSERWAQAAYDAAIIQAARRAGYLPMATKDHAIIVVAVWTRDGWLTNIGTTADPRQHVANMRSKSPVKLEQSYALWTVGAPLAKRIVDAARKKIPGLFSHGAWYKVHPDTLGETLIDQARQIGAEWMMEEIAVKGALAA